MHMKTCLKCGSETKNPKFCSISCGVSIGNKARAKPIKYCKTCNIRIGLRSSYCRAHGTPISKIGDDIREWSQVKIGDLRGIYGTIGAHRRLRESARRVYKNNNGIKVCKICKYSQHINVCHIKAVSDFDDITPVDIVNAFTNLVALCPNHHWEFDNGKIHLTQDAD